MTFVSLHSIAMLSIDSTSANARKLIYRAQYQVQLWVLEPFRDASLTMDAYRLMVLKEGKIHWYLRL